MKPEIDITAAFNRVADALDAYRESISADPRTLDQMRDSGDLERWQVELGIARRVDAAPVFFTP